MKKRQVRNVETKKNRKVNEGLNNKGRRINTKNLPTFILIGLILMLIIIAIIYYVFLRYAPEMIITYGGYAVEGKSMVENLKNSDVSNVNPYLGLIEVQENDLLYKRLNSYYIGEDDKKEIDINYPIYINEGNALLNIGKNTKLITVNYEEVEGYPDFMMTDGVMYNGADITRADGNKYIFLKSEDEIYTNVGKIKITTASKEYEIKEFSNIYFTEDYIAYYEMQDDTDVQNWYMQYKRINDIDENSKIEVNGETLTYKTFLERLGLINTEEDTTKNNVEENTIENETSNEAKENRTEQNDNENTVDNNENDNNKEDEWQEGMWEKPAVSCTDFEGDVYTIRTNLSVTDRAGVITRGITFEIYLDGRLNRRVQVTQTGMLEITGLQPDSEYEIRGVFYYNDESGVEQEEEFYKGKVTTRSIDTLGTIDFSFQNGKIYSNKIELIYLKLNNDLNEEVIKGISRLQVEIGDAAYRLTNDQIDELKAGKEITFQTSENLTSNSKIKYKITAFDRFGNELKEKNNTGETITSKQAPSASIRVTKQDVTEVDLEITLTNKDNVSLDNYRYEITNQSGDVVKQGTLDKSNEKETLIFNDLDPNGYYQIVIYGDYDLENGDGRQQNAELGKASFVTRPLASLGYMQVKIDDKEVTQDEMTLGISIDTNQTDARLVAILGKVEVVIFDKGKNVEDENSEGQQQQETEIKRITLTSEEVEKLKVAEKVELNLDQLNSNTIYKIDVITSVKQGSIEEVVEDKQNLEQVITLKMPAEVQVRNQFVIGNMIDLDMRIDDQDGAVLVDKVRIEVRDKDNKLVDLSEMPTNEEYERKTYEDLTPNETYRIIVYAPQYNEGSTDETYKADFILKEIKIVTETGISGSLDLMGLERTPTGKNLIDVSSKVNWFEKCFPYSVYGLEYDENTKTLTLGGTDNNRISYYDLSKYLGREVTISFKASAMSSTYLYIIEKNNNNFADLYGTVYHTINNLNNESKEYSYTVTLGKTGYIGFQVGVDNINVEIKDLQIELGNKKTDYEEFKYDYNANVAVTVSDARNEITTNDYYIRIYRDGEQVQELRYEEIGEENKIENVQKTYNIEPDAIYRFELLVKISDRYYELDSQEVSTEGAREIKGISNKNDFLKIQPYGEYIVLQDLDFRGETTTVRFGGFNREARFEGRVDFNGKKVLINGKNGIFYGMFAQIGENGIIENLVLDVKFDMDRDYTEFSGVTAYNYGTIRNIQINITNTTTNIVGSYKLVTDYNYGTGVIENFAINIKDKLYIGGASAGGILARNNYGIIRNGYIYGENIKVKSSGSENKAVLLNSNYNNAVLENVFSLVNIDYLEDYLVVNHSGNIASLNENNATVQNVYSVGVGENVVDLAYGPNIITKNSKKIYNNYYFADEIFTSELETKGNKLSLWDAEFQNQLINSDGAFIVDELVNEGYYPHLDMPNVMPAQDYIELPEVEDADLPDILSTKVLEQGTDTVKVQFSVNNPSAEQISDIKIQYLEVEILSQEYNNGKSVVIAELKSPDICVSSYDVLSISTTGAFGSTYTRPYAEGERVINVDLYNEIWNVNDWKAINDSPTENYMLMTDLDFINEGNSINLSNVNGVIDGNGYSISNIILTNDNTLIKNLNGTFQNIYINNFSQETNWNGSLISNMNTGSEINQVHLTDVNICTSSDSYIGGLVRLSTSCSIKNSSVKNIQINATGARSTLYIGGLVGYATNISIENCYTYNINFNDVKTVNSGIGGLVGIGTGTNSIRNCYSEGTINSDNLNTGGIIGNEGITDIENCYSKVDISTTNNNVGGIVGRDSDSDVSGIVNNLSIGNIYTTSGMNGLNRIIGNNSDTANNNYAYKNQLLNGFTSQEEKGATILDKEEILNWNLGDGYNYDGKLENILPKLYNIEGTELLPNQEDILIDGNIEENIELDVEDIEATKPNTTEAEISVRIRNPEEIKITGIEIEDMTVTEVTRNVTQNGITSITVRSTPDRYYDSYKLAGIVYIDVSSGEENIKNVENEIKVQFYKEIYTYEDWQSIEDGTYQNYRLMADIDFNGKDNVKNNITLNRLEAENKIYALKNITLEFNTANVGLINNVKTSIKNIGFENITIKNTASNVNYCGVIATNNADIENISFKNITIEADKMSYIGAIGSFASGSAKNVLLDSLYIYGYSYVGGFSGRCNYEILNINADNINVSSTSDYCGGIFGASGGTTGNPVEQGSIIIKNSSIIGGSYVGGITGNCIETVMSDSSVTDTVVKGVNNVGGMCGAKGLYTLTHCFNNIVDSCEIYGSGYNIGGMMGTSSCYDENPIVKNSKIVGTSVNSNYVGGIAGNAPYLLWYCRVEDSEITSLGSGVGGVAGKAGLGNSQHAPQNSFVKNCDIEGNSDVGGIVGEIEDGYIYNSLVNAKITATSHTAGGIVGLMDVSNMTTISKIMRICRCGTIQCDISAPTKVGGLIGNITKDLISTGFFYNNYVDTNLECDDTENVSMGIGGSKSNNEKITNTHIYKYSQINGEYMNEAIDTYKEEQYVDGNDLRQETTYRDTFGWGSNFRYTSLQNDKYPIPSGITGQEGIDLPDDPEIVTLNVLENEKENDSNGNKEPIETQSLGTLPSWIVYPVSVDEINIDFGDIPEGVSFTYCLNGDEKETVDLTKKTYTFKYNYQDMIEIKLTNGTYEETITINANDVRNEASLVGSNNAYLLGTNLYINGEVQQGEYVNVYGGYALSSNGQVLDIATKLITSETTDNENLESDTLNEAVITELEETTKPLHTYNYKGSNIEVYGTYSTINDNIKLQIYNVRNGELSAISNNVDMKIGNSIIDNYNDKEYQTILTNSGELIDLKEKLQYPENFLRSNIKQIAQNTDVESPEMMVLYNTGKVIVFNYVTGNVVYENDEKADEGLVNYLTRSFANIWNDYENKQQEYAKSKELEAKLAKLPVEEAIKEATNNETVNSESNGIASGANSSIESISNSTNNTNNSSGNSSAGSVNNTSSNGTTNTTVDNNYITVYNADTGEYEVYSEDEILNGDDENPVSETEKIKQNGLEGVYGYDAKEETKPQANGAIIVVAIIAVAIIALVVLRKIIVKNNSKKEKNN